jgi:hypothetical protein
MSGPGDKPDKPDPAPEAAPGGDGKAADKTPPKGMTVIPAKGASAAADDRGGPAAFPAQPGDTGEPMELKGAERPPKPAEKPDAAAAKAPETARSTDKAGAKAGAKTDDPAGEKAAKEEAPKGPKEKAPKVRRGRGAVSWFFAGLGLAVAGLAGAASWNVWSDPHYVVSPRLDALMQDYGGYVAAACLFGLALVAAMLLRRRKAFAVTAFIATLGVAVAVITTVLLGIGAGIMCGRQPVFSQASPDRRLKVIAVRGKCGVTRQYTYRVSVRELGPSVPRQTMIFQSFGRPAPSEVLFITDRVITVLTNGKKAGSARRYTVTIDRKTFRPDKVWRFDVRTD